MRASTNGLPAADGREVLHLYDELFKTNWTIARQDSEDGFSR